MKNNSNSLTWNDSILTVILNKGGVRWVSPNKTQDFKATKSTASALPVNHLQRTFNLPNEDRGQELVENMTAKVIKISQAFINWNTGKPVKKGKEIIGAVFSFSTCRELGFVVDKQPKQPVEYMQRLIAACHELAGDFRSTHAPWDMSWELTEVNSGRVLKCTYGAGDVYHVIEIGPQEPKPASHGVKILRAEPTIPTIVEPIEAAIEPQAIDWTIPRYAAQKEFQELQERIKNAPRIVLK